MKIPTRKDVEDLKECEFGDLCRIVSTMIWDGSLSLDLGILLDKRVDDKTLFGFIDFLSFKNGFRSLNIYNGTYLLFTMEKIND